MGMFQDDSVAGVGDVPQGGGEHALQQSYSVQVLSSKEKVEVHVKGKVWMGCSFNLLACMRGDHCLVLACTYYVAYMYQNNQVF